jgi:hypothetical protein
MRTKFWAGNLKAPVGKLSVDGRMVDTELGDLRVRVYR